MTQPDFIAAISAFIANLSDTGKRELAAALYDASSRNFDDAQRYRAADMDPTGIQYHLDRWNALANAGDYVSRTIPKDAE